MADTKAHTRYRLKPAKSFKKGEIVPGVTTIIDGQLAWNKNALIAWARREALAGQDPEKIKNEAGKIGSCADCLIGCMVTKKTPDLKDFTSNQITEAQKSAQSFAVWWDESGLIFNEYQKQVISEQFRYGGTLDLILSGNGNLFLYDMKRSKGIWPSMKIQIAAYKNAYEEQEGKRIDECYILHLQEEVVTPIRVTPSEIKAGWEVFKHLRSLYDLKKVF